jgi:hypothetical protein
MGDFLVGNSLSETKRTNPGTKRPDDIEYLESVRMKSVSFERQQRWHKAS